SAFPVTSLPPSLSHRPPTTTAASNTVHELGHTYRLSHCPQPRCVMHFSNSLHDTDAKEATFCQHCTQVQGQFRSRAR
ncbi:MAG: hypothetical protein IMY86_04025, partial [Chloroflexi bacterium]|nr:hypothetical protein [Chloroflexota bacterium]